MSVTTIACLWVKGHLPFYTREYVARLAGMVARHLDRPYEFVCLTDRPEAVPTGVRAIRVPPVPADVKAWWWKLRIFDPAIGLAGRVLYIDLDSVVVGPLAPLLDYPADLALVPDSGRWAGKDGLTVVKRFNGSVMAFDAAAHADLWTRYTPALTRQYWSDQDVIGLWKPQAATFPMAWVPRLSTLGDEPPGPDAKVVLAKKPKPHIAIRTWPWVAAAWRAA